MSGVVGTVAALLCMAALVTGLFGGSRLGVRLVEFLFLHHIPARCPGCGGRTYPQARSKSITYRCPSCGHATGTPPAAVQPAAKANGKRRGRGRKRGQGR